MQFFGGKKCGGSKSTLSLTMKSRRSMICKVIGDTSMFYKKNMILGGRVKDSFSQAFHTQKGFIFTAGGRDDPI